jgi:arylsulfatase
MGSPRTTDDIHDPPWLHEGRGTLRRLQPDHGGSDQVIAAAGRRFRKGNGETTVRNPRLVMLVSVDCLRADHLGCYGYGRATSPTIDRMSELGVRFEGCYPQGVYTFPAHVSLLTSIHSATHRLRNGDVLSHSFPTLADYLQSSGYTTAAFVSNGMIAGDLGFRAHFDVYDDGLTDHPSDTETYSRRGSDTTAALLAWLDQRLDRNAFVFLHLNDCHGPYKVPEPYSGLFVGDGFQQRNQELPVSSDLYHTIRPHLVIEDRRDVDYYVSQYDAGIRYVDDQIQAILEFLEARGLQDDALVVLTGDHGEGLGEHDIYFMHGKALYEEFLRVPLIMYGRGLPRGRVVDQAVRHVDILPTVLDLVGVPPPVDAIQGRSLTRMIRFPDARQDPLALFDVWATSAWIRDGTWKYIRTDDHALTRRVGVVAEARRRIKGTLVRPREELYDLERDPAEEHNLCAQERNRTRTMRRQLKQLLSDYGRVDPATLGAPTTHSVGEEQINERLRALGYVD